ncbi:hypothetical protein [Nocardia sp. NPDC057455]|uniref:hypothetical protein n=1 Tax=Nocardia sp. NPDC057455 TaxID=3346138 RepID=UPI00366AA0D2
MSERMSDELFTEIARAIPYSYEAGDYPDDLSDEAREFLGPDGGTLALMNELKAERERVRLAINIADTEQLYRHDPGAPIPACWITYALRPDVYDQPDEWEAVLNEVAQWGSW